MEKLGKIALAKRMKPKLDTSLVEPETEISAQIEWEAILFTSQAESICVDERNSECLRSELRRQSMLD